MIKFIKSKIISTLLIGSLFLQINACGYVLHPERRGKNNGNKLDLTIVALDGIGLLFFIIPGIIAFAVDITNNTIYLPAHGKEFSKTNNSQNLAIKVQGKLNKEVIEKIVKENTGKNIDLHQKEIILKNAEKQYAKLENF